MITTIKANNTNKLYLETVKAVRDKGELLAKTRDLMGVQLILTNPHKNLLYYPKNWKWCFQELFDRMSGVFGVDEYYQNPGLAYEYRPAWKRKLAKEDGKFHYTYGECYKLQVPATIKLLKKEKTTREAIINMWNDEYLLNVPNYNRRPCTLTHHFLRRDDKLHLFTNMRTNDIINLLPYDIFHHTFLQIYIAEQLGLEVGEYHHFASHMYYPKRRELPERNFLEKFINKLENVNELQYEIPSTEFGHNLHYAMQQNYDMYGKDLSNLGNISSPYIREMVKLILKIPTENKEFNCLR